MHDLIQQMDWKVVCQESNKDPTELTRINKPEDFHNLLKNSKLNVYIPIPLKPFSARLKYLEWNSYPLNSLSSMFCVEQLVEFRMPNSQISKLWDGTQSFHQKMSLRFSVDRPKKGKRVQIRRENDEDCFIKGCGVIPMYASTLLDAIQNLELEFNLKPHHNPIPGINLDEVRSMMIRKSKGKSKLH
ncbi:hypothetical protein Ahy_A02g005168 [Arachis hypogaea]|uniref:Uncharacterized protein n=1 Tax=Arachis hypogaea TaxID=3818 RepID=A0A445E5X6_ARAHY|nr:hypothetical protein Ahy_A02g005168 [Arachis hypogaea]